MSRSNGDGPGDASDAPRGEQIGGVAEEAAKLMGALAGWAREHGAEVGSGLGHGVGDLAGHAAAAARQIDDHVATGAPECAWCPVCRTIHTVRSLNPEVRQHLGVAASALAQAAAGILAGALADDRGGRRDPDLEHIDLESDWPEDEWSEDDWPEDGLAGHDVAGDGQPADRGATNDEPDGGAPEHEGPGD